MPSDNYRAYRLDGDGRFRGATWFRANSDEHAIARAGTMHPVDRAEVWLGTRLVAILPTLALAT